MRACGGTSPQDEVASLRRAAGAEEEEDEEEGVVMRGFSTFGFSKMSPPTRREFSKDAPPYRVSCPGLNMEGPCSNAACAAAKARHNVIVQVL